VTYSSDQHYHCTGHCRGGGGALYHFPRSYSISVYKTTRGSISSYRELERHIQSNNRERCTTHHVVHQNEQIIGGVAEGDTSAVCLILLGQQAPMAQAYLVVLTLLACLGASHANLLQLAKVRFVRGLDWGPISHQICECNSSRIRAPSSHVKANVLPAGQPQCCLWYLAEAAWQGQGEARVSCLVSHCCCPDAVFHNSTNLCAFVASQGTAAQFDAFKSNVDFIHTYNAAHPSHQVGFEAAVWQVLCLCATSGNIHGDRLHLPYQR